MYKVYSKSNHLYSLFGNTQAVKTLHGSQVLKLPQVAALKLPSNVVDINASEVGRFSPQRERDICGPVIKSHYEKQADFGRIDITIQADPYAYKYDCCGAVSLSSSMQSNVPSPFAGHNTHLNMPGSQWGQGHKYLSEHLHSAHYLTIKDEYRKKNFGEAVSIGVRKMSSTAQEAPLTTKEKLKKAVKEYGSTVIVFHIGISLMSLGGSYLLVSSGVNIVDILEYIGVGEGTLKSIVSSNAGTFVIAYAVHKCFAPLRIGITLTSTPFIVRYLRNKGILKQTPGVGK